MLLVVTGPPASGKTTLARALAAELGMPLLTKDDVKETLYEVVGSGDRLEQRLEAAALAILLGTARRLSEAGCSAAIEGDFRVGLEERLRDAAAGGELAQLHVSGDPDELAERFAERAERGERHPGHGDEPEDAHEVRELAELGVWDALELGGTLVRVDSRDEPDVAVLARELRS